MIPATQGQEKNVFLWRTLISAKQSFGDECNVHSSSCNHRLASAHNSRCCEGNPTQSISILVSDKVTRLELNGMACSATKGVGLNMGEPNHVEQIRRYSIWGSRRSEAKIQVTSNWTTNYHLGLSVLSGVTAWWKREQVLLLQSVMRQSPSDHEFYQNL